MFRRFLLLVLVLGCVGQVQPEGMPEGTPAVEIAPSEPPAPIPSQDWFTDESLIQARDRMLEDHLEARGIRDERVLKAMRETPRHLMIPGALKTQAYDDNPLPIGEGQTISQPYVVAMMTEELYVSENDTVLEIGTGSGYQAAVLSPLAKEVYTIEIKERLAIEANETLHRLGYENIHTRIGDGYFGWPDMVFDRIIITAAVDHVPPPLIDQLKDGGILILPLGSTKYHQTLTSLTKESGELFASHITFVRFVPMTGKAEEVS